MQRSVLLRNLGWQTTYQFISNLLGFVFTIILARQVSVFYFGVYSYIISVLYIASLFLELGIPNYFLRRWSVSKEKIGQEARLFLGSRILLAIPVSAILFAYVFSLDRFVSLEFVLFYLFFLLDGPLQVQRIFFSSRNEFHFSAAIDIVDRVLASGGGIIALLLGAQLWQVLLLFLISRLIAIVLSLRMSKLNLWPDFSWRGGIQIIRSSGPLFLLAVFSILYFRIDMMIIRYTLGVAAVGIYSAAYRLLEAAVIFPNLLLTVFVPELTNLYAEERHSEIQSVAKKLFFLLAIPSVYIVMAASLYSADLLQFLYKGSYAEAAPVLVVLGWTAFFLFMNVPVSHLLFASHNEKFQTKILVSLTFLNVILNFIFVPQFGILGAGIATLFCEIMSFFFLFGRVKIPFSHLLPIVKIAIVGSIVYFIGYLLGFHWIVEGVVLGIVYILGIAVLFPREMRRYVWSKFDG